MKGKEVKRKIWEKVRENGMNKGKWDEQGKNFGESDRNWERLRKA